MFNIFNYVSRKVATKTDRLISILMPIAISIMDLIGDLFDTIISPNSYRDWYIVECRSGIIVTWQNGDRSANTLQKLLDRVEYLPIRVCHTDNWAAYSKLLPQKYFHIIGKDSTWKIERKNLIPIAIGTRTHLKRLNRKTICF